MAELVVRAGDRQTLVGTSYEAKPVYGEASPGTFFEETDTGRTYLFSGTSWYLLQGPVLMTGLLERNNQLLEELVLEMRAIRIGMIAADTCKEI